MAELHEGSKSAGDNLGLRALLYASGGMDAGETAAFELRLEFDQRAREALEQAVEYLQRWDDDIPAMPDTGYRERVRERLRRGAAAVMGRFSARTRWLTAGVAGLAAAALLGFILSQHVPGGISAPPVRSVAEPYPAPPEKVAAESKPMNDEELGLWADLPRSRHLLKVHHEESERKRRSDLQMRIVLRDGMGQTTTKDGPSN